MLTDEKFLKSIDNTQLAYYFGPEKELNEKNVIELEEPEASESNDLKRIGSEYIVSSSEFIEMKEKLKNELLNIRN